MDLTGLIDQIPIDQVARKLGVDEKQARAAVQTALPAIVAGLADNTKDRDGEAKLEKALTKHTARSTRVDDVDEADGEKIVNHVFGAKKGAVTEAAASKASVGKDVIEKILPIVAPIVLAWLAQKFLAPKASTGTTAKKSDAGGGLGDLLGGLVGSKQGQDALGGLLGGLFGK